MNYRVVWRRLVQEHLHTWAFTAYETGGDPEVFAAAVREASRVLAANPHAAGESREDGERVLILHPLTFTYEVFEAERVVLVYRVRAHPNR